MNQAMVEQWTGLSREVLRKWELRYGFPMPTRGSRGQRIYSHADVAKLLLVKQLVELGFRPGKVMHLPVAELQQAINEQHAMAQAKAESFLATEKALLASLAPGAVPYAAQPLLRGIFQSEGLEAFLFEHLPRFNKAVGDAWAAGELPVHGEHHYTETVRRLLLEIRSSLAPVLSPPRVLLTTPPGELHELGVLALEVALVAAGAYAIYLGPQSTVSDLALAAKNFDAGVVAVSISSFLSAPAATDYVQSLRRALPPDLHLWVGGEGAVTALQDQAAPVSELMGPLLVFDGLRDAVAAWRGMVFKST